jgi:hypothetical protein
VESVPAGTSLLVSRKRRRKHRGNDAGEILNSKTGKHFDWNDECVEKGPSVAYNEEATLATIRAVKELITTLPSAGAATKN